jgi:hypothetical protein
MGDGKVSSACFSVIVVKSLVGYLSLACKLYYLIFVNEGERKVRFAPMAGLGMC